MRSWYCLMSIVGLLSLSFAGAAQANVAPSGDIKQCLNNQGAAIIGLASALDTGEPLYCEYHYPSSKDDTTVVEYWDFNSQMIARKQLDYSSGLASPSVDQQDFRHGERRFVTREGEDWLLGFRRANQQEVVTATLDAETTQGKTLVIDAGFDQVVRQYWEHLFSGKKQTFDFVSPIHGRTITLRVKRRESKRCLGLEYQSGDQACYIIRPSSAFLRLFAKPLALVYDTSTRRLIAYSGTVNITSEDGKDLKASIAYHYSDNGMSVAP